MPGYRYIVLDTNPLGNVAVAPSRDGDVQTSSQLCRDWIEAREQAGTIVLAPAIAYYEQAREMELRRATRQIALLERFCFDSNRFVPLTTPHLRDAASLWARMRRLGLPTSDRHALDADVILAAQVLSMGFASGEYVVATSNPKHFLRLGLDAAEWQNIAL